MINLWVIKDHKLATLHFFKSDFYIPSTLEFYWDTSRFVCLSGQSQGKVAFTWKYVLATVLNPSGLMSTRSLTARKQSHDWWWWLQGSPTSSMSLRGYAELCPMTAWLSCLGTLGMDSTMSSTSAHKSMLKPLYFWHLENQTFHHLQV